MKLMLFDNKDSSHPYGVRFSVKWNVRSEMFRWCRETFGKSWSLDINGVWMILWDGYAFKNEVDRTWFILRWSHANNRV